jgi:hyperosmotically inducible periplasmic protein
MRLPARTTIVLAAAALLASLAGCHRGSDLTAADLRASATRRAAAAPDTTARASTPAASASTADKPAAVRDRAVAAAAPAAARAAPADSTRTMGAPSATLAATIASAAPGHLYDASITRKVSAAIAADKDLRPLKIDVDTQNGIVTLSGPAPTASAKAHADEVARTVQGVVTVNNQLTLEAG